MTEIRLALHGDRLLLAHLPDLSKFAQPINDPFEKQKVRASTEAEMACFLAFWPLASRRFFLYIIEALDRLCNLYLGVLLLLGIDASIFLLAAVSTSVSAFASVLEGSWRQLVSVTAAPVLTIGLLAALLHYKIDADWIHFQFTRHRYEKLVRVIPGGSPKYHLWKWGDTGGAAVVNIFYFLAYDESDTPLENFRRAQAPQARFGDLSARPFGDHFYLVTELYP